MYILNLFQPTLTDKQKEELFSKESFDEMMKKLNEKKEIEEMKTEKELLIETIIEKQDSVLKKIEVLDQKSRIYHSTEEGFMYKYLAQQLQQTDETLNLRLVKLRDAEKGIVKTWEAIKDTPIKIWSEIALNSDINVATRMKAAENLAKATGKLIDKDESDAVSIIYSLSFDLDHV